MAGEQVIEQTIIGVEATTTNAGTAIDVHIYSGGYVVTTRLVGHLVAAERRIATVEEDALARDLKEVFERDRARRVHPLLAEITRALYG